MQNETISIVDHMREAYLDYSLSVIRDRALPDIRDGLKPVHRRILYAFYKLNITKGSSYKKSARIVGDVIGKYHPHGDSSVYEAMVKMAQNFNMSVPLIDGQGNFGSIDGDNPAAMRYTEVRPENIVSYIFKDFAFETVNLIDNYDATEKEPEVLPTQFPNLLLNGSSGIAVGMSTNIPPHNMRELCETAVKFLFGNKPTIESIFDSFKGPDFPTGGIVFGKKGIVDYVTTGKGSIKLRAKTHFETIHNHEAIVVTELPYNVNKSKLILYISNLVNMKEIDGIKTIRDESDRDGVRVVIELKNNVYRDIVLNNLLSKTNLEITFSINLMAVKNDVPKVFTLYEYMTEFINFRRAVVIKRTLNVIKTLEDKLERVLGLIKATKEINKVIKIIRNSVDDDQAKHNLMSDIKLTEKQAENVLSMQLRRLTGLEIKKLLKNKELFISELKINRAIISNTHNIDKIIENELLELINLYKDKYRRTEIVDAYDEIGIEDIIPNVPNVVSITHKGYVRRINAEVFKIQGRSGTGSKALDVGEDDFVEDFFVANAHDTLLVMTEDGRIYSIKVHNLPESKKNSKGRAIVNLIDTVAKVKTFIPVTTFAKENSLLTITKKGRMKRTSLDSYSNIRKSGINDINLTENDEILTALVLTKSIKHIMFFTKLGYAIKIHVDTIRLMGRTVRGILAMTLREDDEIIGAVKVNSGKDKIFIISENGIGKTVHLSVFKPQHRGGLGVKSTRIDKKTGNIVATIKVGEDDDIMVLTKSGKMIRLSIETLSTLSRTAKGFRIIKLSKGDIVVSASKATKDEKNI